MDIYLMRESLPLKKVSVNLLILLSGGLLTGCGSGSDSAEPAPTYSISVNVEGVVGTGFVLQNNGQDNLEVPDNGVFSFATRLESQTDYNVTICSLPSNPEQDCQIQNGTGTVQSSNVSDVQVVCTATPDAPQVSLSYSIKSLEVSWTSPENVTSYNVLVDKDGEEINETDYTAVANGVTTSTFSMEVPLYDYVGASFVVEACNKLGCTSSSSATVESGLKQAVGYFKASNPDEFDQFGRVIALSEDGTTLVVGAPGEDESVHDEAKDNNDIENSGAVYVFTKNQIDSWQQTAYVKAFNSGVDDNFGSAVAITEDGRVLVVGAPREDGSSDSVLEAENDLLQDAGAVYVYIKDEEGIYQLQHYLKSTESVENGQFGSQVAISKDGASLFVTSAHNIEGVGLRNTVYVYEMTDNNWSRKTVLISSNNEVNDLFGDAIDLSDGGETLVVGAPKNGAVVFDDGEMSETYYEGAAYVFSKINNEWSETALLKSANPVLESYFGDAVAIAGSASKIVVGENGGFERAGKVHVFEPDESGWVSTNELSAPYDAESDDGFGYSVALSKDGNKMFVGAIGERYDALGVYSEKPDSNVKIQDGAVFGFEINEDSSWEHTSYIKPKHTSIYSSFGYAIKLSDNGTLAVSSDTESGGGSGVNSDPAEEGEKRSSGAVYLY
ncbi:FG-GAP repeat protein [Alteromonas ponticola]|uniref:FG-GAP repeat protein n=1 Tax=Alteromonas aquimaris TaxID=2998417 RepID=A0ABT3P5M4_9ALTE|nr:FG-GAP repeat protein [Alteromonas aquimaris]MCW8108071.1 FG-GAP repeat protein [Alteromonas aquimaris]